MEYYYSLQEKCLYLRRDSSTAEEFFIEVIIQRHARLLLQDKKLEALGYMSAALDFHLVGFFCFFFVCRTIAEVNNI